MRILVVRFSAIGDCVMAAWAATALRLRHPGAEITWAIEDRCSPVLDMAQLVTHRVHFSRTRWKQRRMHPSTWAEQVRTYLSLRKVAFDVGFDLQGHSKTALCLRLAKPRQRFAAAATDALAARLTPPIGIRPDGTHMVDWKMHVVCQYEPLDTPKCPIMPPQIEAPDGLPSTGFVTIAVGAGHRDKAYRRWSEVANALVSGGVNVVWMGGPGDSAPDVSGTVDLCGKLTLNQSLEVIRRAAVVVAADTGAGHIAAALGVPVVSVFGPTDPRVFRPYTTDGEVLKASSDPNEVLPSEVVSAALSRGGLQ
jgi:ADP-heptose:LPS heptosyltransferase